MPKKIVIIDDERIIREPLFKVLTNKGFEVVVFESVEKALQMIKILLSVDLIITDIETGGQKDGLDLAETIRQSERSDLPIIVMSGNWPMYELDQRNRFATIRLKKPVDLIYLLEMIDPLLN